MIKGMAVKTVYPSNPAKNFQDWMNEITNKNNKAKGFDKAIREHHFKMITKSILIPKLCL